MLQLSFRQTPAPQLLQDQLFGMERVGLTQLGFMMSPVLLSRLRQQLLDS